LNHPNILVVHDVAIDTETPYVVSELIEGHSLRKELNRGRLALARLTDIAVQIADTLVAAHAAQLVHRDLKPENVMITKAGRVKIVDFGLAEGPPLADQLDTDSAAHTMPGTPAYMSPEQARGAAVDFRSDLFSFGAVLYEMATGRRAFEGASPIDTLSAILHEEPRPIRELNRSLPVELQRVVQRCMAKRPDDRYAATPDLLADLRVIAGSRRGFSVALLSGARARVGTTILVMALAAAAFVAGWIAARATTTAPIVSHPSWRQLTFRRGYVHGARFTPDGQGILYSAAWDTQPVTTFTMSVLTPDTRALDLPPAGLLAVSPSGQLALSLGCRFVPASGACTGTLAQVAVLGGAPRPLAENVRAADWGLNDTLATVTLTPRGSRVEYPMGTVVSDRGGGHVRVSPDGRRLAFTETDLVPSGGGTLSVIVGEEGHRRTMSAGWTFVSGLAWAPDGSALYISGLGDRSRDDTLLRLALDGTVQPVLRSMPRIRVLDAGANGRLLVDRGSEGSRLVRHPAQGSDKPEDLTWLSDSTLDGLSDDGSMVLFTVRAASFDWNVPMFPIYVRPTSGGAPTLIGSGYGLAISPDQQSVLARSRPATGVPSLIVYPLGPGPARTLERGDLDVGTANSIAVFAGAERIVFRARVAGGPWRSYVQRIASGAPSLLAHEPGAILSPVSPDGRHFISARDDGSWWLTTLEPMPSTRIPATFAANQRVLQWTPDGKSVYVATTEMRQITIVRLSLQSGETELVRRISNDGLGDFTRFGLSGGARISRDGTIVISSDAVRLSDLFLVEQGTSD
jgi:eukaryotic-like serine/threonine-protein kinase